MSDELKIINGKNYTDERGTLIFFNEFDITPVKRFYTIEHPDEHIIRAWQGHKIEQKWFYSVAGSFKVLLIAIDDWQNPSAALTPVEYNLSSANNSVLHIPGGYASGFKATSANSKLIVFSDFTLDASKVDDYRFAKDLWYTW